jgi:hypothetical protein
MTITISFSGVAVDATLNSHAVHTSPMKPLDDDSTAISTVDVFFSSIDTCLVPMNGAGVLT